MALAETVRLHSGRVVRLQMPDLPALLLTTGRVPNQALLAVVHLLVRDGLWQPDGQAGATFERKRAEILGWYGVASLMLVEPRLVLHPQTPNPEADEIGAADLTLADAEVIYGYFRYWRDLTSDARGTAPAGADAGGAAGGGAAGEPVGDAPRRARRAERPAGGVGV